VLVHRRLGDADAAAAEALAASLGGGTGQDARAEDGRP
jgi:hypothetical protein